MKKADSKDANAMHFDLVLSPDNQTLHGYCRTNQRRQECTLARYAGIGGVERAP